MNDIQVSKNFRLSEFECKDGSHAVRVNKELVKKLQELRDTVGKPIQILSAYRTKEYNAKVGGAPQSQHLLGNAADIRIPSMTPLEVAVIAEKIGFKGIGVYTHCGNMFTHVDVRPAKSYWKDADGHKTISISSLKEVK